jgi:hypothetical protein
MTIFFIITFQFTILLLFVYFSNRKTHKKIENFIEVIKKDALLQRKQIKCKTSVFGAGRNTSFYFNSCDIYLTNKTIVIVGNPKFNLFNRSFSPIVISKDSKLIPSKCIIFEPIIDVYKNRNENLTLKFGNIFEAEVEISFSGLKEHEINMIEAIINS